MAEPTHSVPEDQKDRFDAFCAGGMTPRVPLVLQTDTIKRDDVTNVAAKYKLRVRACDCVPPPPMPKDPIHHMSHFLNKQLESTVVRKELESYVRQNADLLALLMPEVITGGTTVIPTRGDAYRFLTKSLIAPRHQMTFPQMFVWCRAKMLNATFLFNTTRITTYDLPREIQFEEVLFAVTEDGLVPLESTDEPGYRIYHKLPSSGSEPTTPTPTPMPTPTPTPMQTPTPSTSHTPVTSPLTQAPKTTPKFLQGVGDIPSFATLTATRDIEPATAELTSSLQARQIADLTQQLTDARDKIEQLQAEVRTNELEKKVAEAQHAQEIAHQRRHIV